MPGAELTVILGYKGTVFRLPSHLRFVSKWTRVSDQSVIFLSVSWWYHLFTTPLAKHYILSFTTWLLSFICFVNIFNENDTKDLEGKKLSYLIIRTLNVVIKEFTFLFCKLFFLANFIIFCGVYRNCFCCDLRLQLLLSDLLNGEPQWIDGPVCHDCGIKFSVTTRKHHWWDMCTACRAFSRNITAVIMVSLSNEIAAM